MRKQKNDEQLHMIDQETAVAILDRVYENCHRSQIDTSMESLGSYIQYRRERHLYQRIFLVIVLVFVLMLPIWFITPKFSYTPIDGPNGRPAYSIHLHTILPVKSVIVTEDDWQLPVYERDFHEYEIESWWFEDITVTITLFNGQYVTQEIPKVQ